MINECDGEIMPVTIGVRELIAKSVPNPNGPMLRPWALGKNGSVVVPADLVHSLLNHYNGQMGTSLVLLRDDEETMEFYGGWPVFESCREADAGFIGLSVSLFDGLWQLTGTPGVQTVTVTRAKNGVGFECKPNRLIVRP